MKKITLESWKNRKFVEWESLRNYRSNIVAISLTTGERYELHLTGDDIVWWMEVSEDELIQDSKLTADTTDGVLGDYADQICAEYIAADLEPESQNSDLADLTNDEIFDLYDRLGLFSLVYGWLETGRENLRRKDYAFAKNEEE